MLQYSPPIGDGGKQMVNRRLLGQFVHAARRLQWCHEAPRKCTVAAAVLGYAGFEPLPWLASQVRLHLA